MTTLTAIAKTIATVVLSGRQSQRSIVLVALVSIGQMLVLAYQKLQKLDSDVATAAVESLK